MNYYGPFLWIWFGSGSRAIARAFEEVIAPG
jgi:hypothetical protein